ncbi:hypothetical protein ACFXB3_26190, partial [Streptomyces sp. NPDC059447]
DPPPPPPSPPPHPARLSRRRQGVHIGAPPVNHALTLLYGQVKRLERGEPEPDETMESAAQAKDDVWLSLKAMRQAMREDLGVE